jgi:hypothetical protein
MFTPVSQQILCNKSLPEIQAFVESGNKITISCLNIARIFRKPQIFIYLAEHIQDEDDFETAMKYAMEEFDFFESLITKHGMDPLMKHGILLTIARKIYDYIAFNFLMSQIQSIDLNSEADIIQLSDACVAETKDTFIYPVGYVYDPLTMIRYGFFPTSLDTNSSYFTDYVTGMDINTLEFWYTKDDVMKLLSLTHEPRWSYKTLQSHRDRGISLAISLPLMLYAPEFVYQRSKRPVNDMALFRSPMSMKIKRSDIVSDTVIIDGEEWKVIPVTRYAQGMKRGLYFESSDIEYCGTFYYYEPESTTLLAYKTSASYFNKYTAVIALNNKSTNSKTLDDLDKLSQNEVFMDYVNGLLPSDLMMVPREYNEDLRDLSHFIPYSDNMLAKVALTPHYIGTIADLYAQEDSLDQPLCELGKANNLDIIILESMPGNYQVVTEILDTRNREDSFRSLVYIVD